MPPNCKDDEEPGPAVGADSASGTARGSVILTGQGRRRGSPASAINVAVDPVGSLRYNLPATVGLSVAWP